MDSEQAFDQLKNQTDAWVASLVPDNYLARLRLRMPKDDDTKIIRDAVSGYQILFPHEYLVLDHPVLQRLRYIHQTALAYLVYPTATHTRFEHSLGCAKIAKDMGERLIQDDKTRVAELRLAALLHDVGHTFFSHLSETIMESHFKEWYDALKEAREFKGLKLQLSEMMSYLIVTSKPFYEFLNSVVGYYYESGFDLDNVTRLIKHDPTDALAYMADMISGPFDVDKLDYLVRDCYFTGIRADVDVERVVVSVARLHRDRFPATDPQWQRRSLVMLSGGVSILEQITFNRMLLFPAVYHHHKVRAIECMVKSIFEIIWEEGQIKDNRLKFENILDFYKLTEPQFFTLAQAEETLQPVIDRLLKRDLLERCLVLSSPYIKETASGERKGWKHFAKRHYEDSSEEIRWLRELIFQELPKGIKRNLTIHDLWVDIPVTPPLGDPEKAFVDIGTPGKLYPLSEFFPYPHWLSGYESNKLKGHVFSLPEEKTRLAVNYASQKVLRKEFKLRFEPRATLECKID